MRSTVLWLLLALAPPVAALPSDAELTSPPAEAAAPDVVEAHVTGVAGDTVVLDVGRADGVRPGDLVVLYPPGAAQRDAIVRDVSERTTRAQLLPGSTAAVDLSSARAEVRIADRPKDEYPWQAPAETWEQEKPLLAPARPLEPKERDPRWGGRAFLSLNWDRDQKGGGADYLLGRVGFDGWYDNLFGQGETLNLEIDGVQRGADTADSTLDQTRLRVNRLSWSMGGNRFETRRLEFGRFLPSQFPQLGLLDGAEFAWRLESGDVVGGTIGLLPEPTGNLDTGDDAQVSAFYRYFADEERRLQLGAAAQKTWHEGKSDRDLLVFDGQWIPHERFSLFGSAWVDFYGSGDDIKDGAELSEAHVDATWRPDSDTSYGVFLSHFTFPELLRNEFTPLQEEELDDARTSRIGVRASRRFSRVWRLSGRLNRWSDEEDSGGGGEVSLERRDLFENGALAVDVFATNGTFTDLVGIRLRGRSELGPGFVRASFEAADRENALGFGTQATDGVRNRLRLGYDTSLGSSWTLSIDGEQRFGADEDSRSLGLFLQRRF